ncbi:unnamed protein product [Anisakis simplex]|uniref:Transthyretin-like family protein n=1 Tax=Anisakis simplex TaxID=6269 RepID=A0A0M3JXD1_ANISI|nr:unnamed protein product [Anisakis simplex]
MLLKVVITLIVSVLAVVNGFFCTPANVTVDATFLCANQAVANALVELLEHDLFDPDDVLSAEKTSANGNVILVGEECEIGRIEPYLMITHHCYTGKIRNECTVVDLIEVPQEYIGKVYRVTGYYLDKHKPHYSVKC